MISDDLPAPDLPTPDVAVAVGPVRRAVPHLGRRWGPVLGEVSGLLMEVADLGFRDALRAWGRLSAALRRADGFAGLGFVTVDAADVALLGRAARELGDGLLPGADPGLASVLFRESDALGCRPEDLLVQMARIHGVLDLDLGPDGEVLRHWGADGPVFVTPPGEALAAHRRIAARVHLMWRAGEDGPP